MTLRFESPMRGINTIIRPDGSEIHIEDIATIADGQVLLDELEAAIIAIEAQIADSDAAEVGRDPEWRRRASVALKRKRVQRPRLHLRIAELRKAERQARAQAAAATAHGDGQRKAFVLAAADLLPSETVTKIWARAKEMRPAVFVEGGLA